MEPKLTKTLKDYGDHWQIEYLRGRQVWEAVSRPTPRSLVVHIAFDLDKLRQKIEQDG